MKSLPARPSLESLRKQAKKLARMFADNFKTFEATATDDVKKAGPRA